MGSIGAMRRGSRDRYFQDEFDLEGGRAVDKLVPEGIEGRVAHKGSAQAVIHQLMGGLRAGMGYCGSGTIAELQRKAKLIRITTAGVRESHVHDVTITKEAPNYRMEQLIRRVFSSTISMCTSCAPGNACARRSGHSIASTPSATPISSRPRSSVAILSRRYRSA